MSFPRFASFQRGRQPRASARRVRTVPGTMNKLEARYAEHLSQRRDITAWKFDPVAFRLTEKTFYRPDFMVVYADGRIAFHDVKARWGQSLRKRREGKPHWEDDARVKIKWAAQQFPQFLWEGVSHLVLTDVWERETFNAKETRHETSRAETVDHEADVAG